MKKKLFAALVALILAAAPASATYIPSTSDPSTSAKQDTGNVSLASIDSKTPASPATSGKQDTIIGHVDGIETSLSSIDGKITAVNTGAVVVSSSALPSGAATAAKQPALGTAGSASADVISVQGVASMTALKVDGSAVTQPVSGTITAVTSITNPVTITDGAGSVNVIVDSGSVTASDPTFTDATGTAVPANAAFVAGTDGTNTRALKTDSGGELQVDVLSMPTTTITDGSGSLNVIVDSITAGDNNIGNVDIVTMPNVTNAGTFAVQVDGSALTALQLIDDPVFTDDTSTHSTGSTKVFGFGAVATPTDAALNSNDIGMPGMTTNRELWASITTALPAGTNAIGKLAANSGVDIGDVDVTSIAAGDNNIGDVDVASIAAGTNNIGQVSVAPQTANGLSVFNGTSSDGGTALTNSAQAIKASAGQVYGWFIYNPNATAQYVQFYNTAAASVVVGTTSPLYMLTIPATSGANVEFTNGITFSNAGFSCAATSTAGGNGAPSTALEVVVFYK